MEQMKTRRKYGKPAVQEAIFEVKFKYENFDATTVPGQVFERGVQVGGATSLHCGGRQ